MNKPREKGQKNLGRSLPKGRGKEVEFRSKKQKNELHILKMSQEWDLRRQKRRLDRQKWVEERRNQKLPIWQRVGNLRVQANEEIVHDASNDFVNKEQQIIENSNETTQIRVTNDDKVNENSLEPQRKELEKAAFLVQTSRSLESTVSVEGTGFSSNQKKDSDVKFIKIEQGRTMEHPFLYNVNTLKTSKTSTQITEDGPITAFKISSKSPSKQDEGHNECGKSTEIGNEGRRRSAELTSVAIQKFIRMERANGESEKVDRKRKREAIEVDGDIGEIRPTLMRVNKPTTLENIERENGPVAISSSPNTSVVMKSTRGGVNQTENGKGEEMLPQIKQCYSLLDRREESPNVNFFAEKKSPSNSTPGLVSRASPVTTTTTHSEVKGQVAQPSVPVDPKCIVYLAKAQAPVPTPGSPTQPRPGYLVPVYKASTREAAYAFLPAGAQRTHRVGDKPAVEARSPNRKNECSNNGSCTTVIHHMTRPHPSLNSKTGLKEVHTKCVPSTGKFVSSSQGPPSLYSDHTHPNTRVHSCYDPISTSVTLNPSRTESTYTNGSPASWNSKNPVVNIQKTTTAYSVGPPRTNTISSGSAAPLTQEIKGGKISPRDKPHYPAICRTPEIAPNQTALNAQEPIFNPMSVYVRAKLVPREVVAVNHGAEPTSPPLVEYIKTGAICDKELTKWTAQNVADFIAATDCADKAELFLEQEIDGKALLSLSPEMLMKGMNLKLGPSVKLYNHIANLRTALLLQ